jgi:hypothetical protein
LQFALCIAPSAAFAQFDPAEDFGKEPTLKAASYDEVRAQATAWLEVQTADEAIRAQAAALWPAEPPVDVQFDLLDRLALTFALADADARGLVEFCSQPRQDVLLPDAAWLHAEDGKPAFVRSNLRVVYGRWLSREKLYDESLAQLDGLQPNQVIDPAALLFYQSVAHHRLLNKEPGLKAIRQLLDDVAESPQRYTAVAGLMHEDLKALKDDSLDHISRRMDDIRRRLDLGRAGPKVRKIEDDVVASLDKLIEEMEKQAQQQGGGGSGGAQSSSPAPDSNILGGRGPGNVDRRNLGNSSGWGDLPPKQREEALQQIGKDFPSHYREVIEQYFRKLASEESPK